MVRILREALADYEKLKKVLINSEDPHVGEYVTADDADDMIKDFKNYKDYFSPEKRDLYYWVKLAKTNKDVFDALENEINRVRREQATKKAYKKFCELYPASVVRKFNKYKGQLAEQQRKSWMSSYEDWVNEYEITQGRSVEELKTLLRKFELTPEEQEEVQRGSKKVGSVNGFDIWQISNYFASEYYGQNTGWCISGNYPGHEQKGKEHFKEYLEEGNTYYYFLIKDFKQPGEEDYCVRLIGYGVGYEIWRGTERDDSRVIVANLPEEEKEVIKWILDKEGIIDLTVLTEEDKKEWMISFVRKNQNTRNAFYSFYSWRKGAIISSAFGYYNNNFNVFKKIYITYLCKKIERNDSVVKQNLTKKQIKEKAQIAFDTMDLNFDDKDEISYHLSGMYNDYNKWYGPAGGVENFLCDCGLNIYDFIDQLFEMGQADPFLAFKGAVDNIWD